MIRAAMPVRGHLVFDERFVAPGAALNSVSSSAFLAQRSTPPRRTSSVLS
jgi:hypothetical protein